MRRIVHAGIVAAVLSLGATLLSTPKTADPGPRSAHQAGRAQPGMLVWGGAAPAQERPTPDLPAHSFYFTRAAYSSGSYGWRRRSSWATDYPKADNQFLVVLKRVTNLDAYDRPHPLRLDDPELRKYPFLYAVEVGHMGLSDAEVKGLRDYLLAGGFLMADDFWGTREWRVFESNIRRVFPDREIVEIPLSHEVFRSYYQIDTLVQVPAVTNLYRRYEQDGFEPHLRGIFDDDGRLMVAINWNTDLGDAWEWADVPQYPLEYSTFAYEMAVNLIVYAMSH